MRRRDFIAGLGASVAPTAWLSAAPAQRRPMQVIGYVSTITPEADAGLLNAFRQALRRDRLCRVACVDPTSSSPLLGLAVTCPENRSVRSLLSVWASTRRGSSATPCRNRCDPTVIYHGDRLLCPLSAGGRGMHSDSGFGLLAGLSAGLAAKNWLARERCPSKRRTAARRQHHAVLTTSNMMAADCTKGEPQRYPSRAATFARTTISCAPNRKAMNRGR
jgi:hypothetical protein